VTSIEAGFEVIGLTNSKLIMDFLFKETAIGLSAFAIGFIISLWKSARRGDFFYLFHFLFLFIAVWFIFIVPVTGTPRAISTMETFGYKEIPTENLIARNIKTDRVSTILSGVSRMFNFISIGTIQALTKATRQTDYNYLKSPFLINKISLQAQRFTGEGIQDTKLRKEVINFFYEYYLPTISIMSKTEGGEKVYQEMNKWWPGYQEVVANYSTDGQKEWASLKAKLLVYISNKGVLDSITQFVKYATNTKYSVEDRVLISLLDSEIKKSGHEMSSKDAYGTSKGFLGGILFLGSNPFQKLGKGAAWIVTTIWQMISTVISQSMLQGLPYIEGYACLIMYSLFPFSLLLCLIVRSGMVLFNYFKYLFWVKSWVIIWALIHYASLYMADIQARVSPGVGWFWERPYFNVVTATCLIMSPILAMYFVNGVISGIGEIGSALTLHVDKAIGKAEQVGKAVGIRI